MLQQRRPAGNTPAFATTNSSDTTSSQQLRNRIGRRTTDRTGTSVTPTTILLAALLIFVASFFLFPNSSTKTAEIEAEVVDWWQGHHGQQSAKAPVKLHDADYAAEIQNSRREATQRMEAQTSTWVDGEKRLKQRLKVLADRQATGVDLGVPVLTRYLGEDFPAWPSEFGPDKTMDKDEWESKRKEKYAQMRQEEEEWRIRIGEIINQENRG